MHQLITLVSALIVASTLALPTRPAILSDTFFDIQQGRRKGTEVDGEKEINKLIETLNTIFSTYREDVGSLVKIGKPAVPALLKALRERSEYQRVEAITQALIGIHDPSSSDELYRIARSNQNDFSAIRILGYLNGPRVVGYLADLMKTKDGSSLVAARHGLIRQGAGSVPALLEIVRGRYDGYRREGAIAALGEIQDKAALPVLEQAAKEPNESLRNRAIKAKEIIQANEKARQDRRRIWLLIDSQIDQKYYDFSNPIIRALSDIGSPATPFLMEMLTNWEPYGLIGSHDTEPLIYRALSVIGDSEAVQFLIGRVAYVVENRYYADQPGMVDRPREGALHDALVRLGKPIIVRLDAVSRRHSDTKPVGSSHMPSKDSQIRGFIADVIRGISKKK